MVGRSLSSVAEAVGGWVGGSSAATRGQRLAGAENCSRGGTLDHQRSCDPVANLRARVSDIILVSGVRKVSCWHVNEVIESLCMYDFFLGLPRGAQAIRGKPRGFEVYRTLLALHVYAPSHVSLGGGVL